MTSETEDVRILTETYLKDVWVRRVTGGKTTRCMSWLDQTVSYPSFKFTEP